MPTSLYDILVRSNLLIGKKNKTPKVLYKENKCKKPHTAKMNSNCR